MITNISLNKNRACELYIVLLIVRNKNSILASSTTTLLGGLRCKHPIVTSFNMMFSKVYNRFERSGYCNPAVNMSGRVIREIRDPLESLERMLNRTTLTTQRVQHDQIISKKLRIVINILISL